ncbi:MAG: transcription termination/antitermination protein NusG [bacterium]
MSEWFIIHTYSGYENKVKANIENAIVTQELGSVIFHVEIPMEEAIKIEGGRRVISKRKCYPGYVFIEMDVSDPDRTREIQHMIRNIPAVTGFIGGNDPIPLTESEVGNVLKHTSLVKSEPKVQRTYGKGERVRVIDGPFATFDGVVEEVMDKKEKVRVAIEILGRKTPVELDFLQVEKF